MSFHPFSATRTRQALLAQSISQEDERRYWLYSSLIWIFYNYQSAWFGLDRNWFVLYDVAVGIAILWIGINESFKANRGGQGQDFLKRLAMLGLPLGVAVLVVSQVLYWTSWFAFPWIFDGRSFKDPAFAWQVVSFLLFQSIQVWFWWRMHRHLVALTKEQHV